MHPDKRKAGRRIRKHRRTMRKVHTAFSSLGVAMNLFSAQMDRLATAFSQFGGGES